MEGVTLALGGAVVKSAVKLWLGDRPIAADASASAVDLLIGRASDALSKRKTQRLFDQLEEVVAVRLERALKAELERLDEREAVIAAVRETLEQAALTDEDLFASDLDPAYLNRYIRQTVPGVAERYLLSTDGNAFYDRLLMECCIYLVQITKTLPTFQAGVLTELLRRESETLDAVTQVLLRLPHRRGASDFEADYRQQVLTTLDRMYLFGARVSKPTRRYPLSVAYLSLRLSNQTDQTGSLPADDVIQVKSRLLIRGEAGSGKTTLLQWVAVRRRGKGWRMPFFLRLRRFATDPLPTPERFLDDIGRHIADEMPPGWVQETLRTGRGIVLVDGVDELPEDRRPHVHAWLGELIETFPKATYFVTSRPAAVEVDWLEDYGFAVAELQPMTAADVRSFVHRWHEAMRSQCVEQDEIDELTELEARLIDTIADRRALRRLSENPLLCALLCAMHREQRGEIPESRMELYETTLTVLLESREKERGLATLTRTEQIVLLSDLAYWMVRNGLVDAARERVVERLAKTLESTAHSGEAPEAMYRRLLERTGLLREAVVGRMDFVHRSFQDYLAAKAAVEADDIGVLIDHSHLEPWHEVVVMAAGHASRKQRDELLKGLLRKRIGKRQFRDRLDLLAVACLETSPDLDPALREEIQRRTSGLLPPRDDGTARILARGGEFVLDLLAKSTPTGPAEVAATIRAAAYIGGDAAMRFVARFANDPSHAAKQALWDTWDRFDPEEYARVVLRGSVLDLESLTIRDPNKVAGLRHLRNLRRLVYEASDADRARLDLRDVLAEFERRGIVVEWKQAT
ncbi:NACHT domain-containing protein [Flindersiella endophytica]